MRHPSAFVADCHLIDEPTRELELGTHLGQPLTSGFSCTNAERAQVQAVIGRAVTVAKLRRAVGTAVAQAQRDARAASRALRARPRSVRTSRIFPSIFNVPPTFVPSRRPGYASWPDLGRQRPVDAGDAGRPGVARKHPLSPAGRVRTARTDRRGLLVRRCAAAPAHVPADLRRGAGAGLNPLGSAQRVLVVGRGHNSSPSGGVDEGPVVPTIRRGDQTLRRAWSQILLPAVWDASRSTTTGATSDLRWCERFPGESTLPGGCRPGARAKSARETDNCGGRHEIRTQFSVPAR